MPRHRIDTQRPWTLWPAAGQPARRVPVRAAGKRAKPAHAREVVAPEWRQQLARNQRRMLKRAGRRLLVSPWFAAGAGVVIATSAIVIVPHDLSFQGAIRIHHCKQIGCTTESPAEAAPGQPAGTGGGQLTPSPSSTNVPAGMTFSYQPPRSDWNGFSMWITIRVPAGLGPWKVSFVIPGTTGVYIYGATHAQPFGTDGVTVSSVTAELESASYAAVSGHQAGADSGSSGNFYTLQFQVRGNGTPQAPSQCLYNGAAHCQFQRSHSEAGASWPG